jgi:hypothetical protein
MALVLASTAVLGFTASGCESTRERAAKFAKEGDKAFAAKGLDVGAANRAVAIVSTAVISDENGSAVVAVLRNEGPTTLVNVPVELVVRDASGSATARNDAPGLENGLTHVALLPPGRAVTWVNDQLSLTGGRPSRATLTVGRGEDAPSNVDQVSVEIEPGTRVVGDPASGLTAVGRVRNDSSIAQRDLVVACTARRGARAVAAGRSIVPSLAPGRRDRFNVYFIGNPTGAQLDCTAQPTTFQ